MLGYARRAIKPRDGEDKVTAHDHAAKTRFHLGVVKPSSRGKASHNLLMSMLPDTVTASARYAPVQEGRMEEFEAAIPFYEASAGELAQDGADLVHLEGTPPFLILGYEQERRTVLEWEQRYGVPMFTSAMCQVNALRALGASKLVDAGYDPTTGPIAERYFRDAGFDVLAVEKVGFAWTDSDDISDEQAFAVLSDLMRRYPDADSLCLQGSSKWRLASVIPRLEEEFGIVVVHPVAARYWELLDRFGLKGPRNGLGRLLAEMPPRPA
jgi:maleate cis-trans isomerase